MTKLIDVLSQLVALDTSAGHQENFERGFALVNDYLQPLGLKPREYSDEGVKSVVWSNSTNHLEPRVLLSAHLDVVPGNDEQFCLKKMDGKAWGRGVSDMKFAIASFIVVLNNLYKHGKIPSSIAVMITSDEEQGGMNGTNHLVNRIGYRPKLVILPDGGENFSLVVESKGVLHLKVTTAGRGAHAAFPWEGESAIDKLIDFLNRVRKLYPQPKVESWINTVNIGQINGGIQTNQVADKAEARLDFRLIPGTDVDGVVDELQQISEKAGLERLIVADSFHIDTKNRNIKRWIKTVKTETGTDSILSKDHGASDARFFSPYNIPVVMSKPKSGGDHSPEEWLEIDSWKKFTQCLERFLSGAAD